MITPELNLHRFVALEDSIFFDVISPDYDDKEVFLNYYEEKGEPDSNGHVTLQMKPLRAKNLLKVEANMVF